jgi:hypothetical protein
MMEQAKHKAEEVKQDAGEMLRTQAGKGSTQAGEKVHSTAQDLHTVSDTLREQGRDSAARFVEQGAAQAERLADYLRHSDADTILNDVQDYARRQPWVVALGGLALGLMAARMVKAAGETSYRPSHRSDMYQDYEGHSPYASTAAGTYGSSESSESPSRHLRPVTESSTSEQAPGYQSGQEEKPSDYLAEDEDEYRPGEAGGGRPF